MLNSINTPSHNLKSNFFSNIRRVLRSNSQLTSVSESFFDSPDSPKRLFSTAVESPSHIDTSSSYATSSGSSNPSSPASNTPSRPPNPPQRGHSSLFNKVTFSMAEFMEDQHVYSRSPEKLCLSYESMSDESPLKDGLDCASFFDVPNTRQAFVGRTIIRSDGDSHQAAKQLSFPTRVPQLALYEAFDELTDLLPEFVYQDSSRSTKTSKAPLSASSGTSSGSCPETPSYLPEQYVQSSGMLITYHDSYCSEAYPSELGLDDSPTLGYLCEFPSLSNHSSPKENNSNGKESLTIHH